MGKRLNGEGTIRKRKDGRWECRLAVGSDENGKVIIKNALAKSHQEIVEKLEELRKRYHGVVVTDIREITVGEWLDRWLEEYKKPFIRIRTYDGYRYSIDLAKEKIGYIKLNRLKSEDMQKLYNDLHKSGRKNKDPEHKGLSSAMVRKVHLVLHGALEYAVNERMIPSNPSIYVKLPRMEDREKQVLDEEELERFIDGLDNIPELKDLFYLELMTGLRRGEICGLKWSDFDEEEGTLSIERTVNYRNGELIIGETKTDEGTRIIILPMGAVDMLIERRESAVTEWVFPRFTNPLQPISPNYVYQRLQDLLDSLNIKRMAFHDLRHTFATHAAKNGIDPKTLSGLLGHTNASFTLDTYTHVTTEMQRNASRVTDKFLDDILDDDIQMIL